MLIISNLLLLRVFHLVVYIKNYLILLICISDSIKEEVVKSIDILKIFFLIRTVSEENIHQLL